MFLTRNASQTGYTPHGEQKAGGLFLVFCQPADAPIGSPLAIRCFVRPVRLAQCGHWMMGAVTIHGHRIPLSGTYGADGLPREVPRAIYDAALPLPAELQAAWNTGGGWNGAGSEAGAVREWALANLAALRKAGKAGRHA